MPLRLFFVRQRLGQRAGRADVDRTLDVREGFGRAGGELLGNTQRFLTKRFVGKETVRQSEAEGFLRAADRTRVRSLSDAGALIDGLLDPSLEPA